MIKSLENHKIIRNSDENTFYMKVAQNDETNSDTQPVRPPHPPNLSNTQLFPSGSSVRKRETPGILSRLFSPFADITIPALDYPWHHVLPCYILCDALFSPYVLFLPPLLLR